MDTLDRPMTLAAMKGWLLASGRCAMNQRGPNDIAGYEADAAVARKIRGARTWDDLAAAVPQRYAAHVANRDTNP